jgi:hypothetical protein
MILRPCVVVQIGHNADSPLSIVLAQWLVMDLVMPNVSRGVIERRWRGWDQQGIHVPNRSVWRAAIGEEIRRR